VRLKVIAYTSRARLDLGDDELQDIHRTARELNALDGITGLLAFDGSRFLQIIEGAEDAIDNLVRRLRNDRRHSAFEIRDERFVEERSFHEWSMELVLVSAGYLRAIEEIGSKLPENVAPAVRDIAFRMSDELSRAY
jgi:hypothetical protein